jgi:hypothetical protein
VSLSQEQATLTIPRGADMLQANTALKLQQPRPSEDSPLPPRRTRRRRSVKQRLTVTMSTSLLDRLRNAVYWTPALTLAGLIETAVEARLQELEAQNGEPFPARVEELKGGRPRQIRLPTRVE